MDSFEREIKRMNRKPLTMDSLKRGDIIKEIGYRTRYIVRLIEAGMVYTVEKNTSKRGPVLTEQELTFYERVNVGENNSDTYREKIIRTYLERNTSDKAKETKKKYRQEHKAFTVYYAPKERDELASFIKESGLTAAEYFLRAARYYEENKEK